MCILLFCHLCCLLFACDEGIITGAISLVDDVNGGDGSSLLSSLVSFSLIHCNRPPPAAVLFSIVSLSQIKHEAEGTGCTVVSCLLLQVFFLCEQMSLKKPSCGMFL